MGQLLPCSTCIKIKILRVMAFKCFPVISIVLLIHFFTAKAEGELSAAARNGDLSRVRSILNSDGTTSLEERDEFFREETALVGAARNGHLEVVSQIAPKFGFLVM